MTEDVTAPLAADFARYRVEPGERIDLDAFDTADTAGLEDRADADAEMPGIVERIADLQARLYAEEARSLLVVLQGIDAAGKDSSVKHVFGGVNPQGCRVYTFKQPSSDEAAHDFLWRYHQHTPGRGMIHVFNRSHYEDVLVVRVKGLVEEERWRSRYDSINDFERMLVREGTVVLKFFLHISLQAQLDRFRERLERTDKHYKFSSSDVRERRNWDAYQEAFADMLTHTSTPWAPWHVVPADHKWFRNYVVARAVAGTLAAIDPQWPEPDEDLEGFAAEELDQVANERSSR